MVLKQKISDINLQCKYILYDLLRTLESGKRQDPFIKYV
jgi:hypothetical protein